MGMVFSCLQNVHEANGAVDGARNLASALSRAVEQAKLDGVHGQSFAQLVNDLLGGKGGRRTSRRPVGGHLLLIHGHVQGFDGAVGNVVRGEDAPGGSHHEGGRDGPALVEQISLSCRDAPFFGGPNLHLVKVPAAGPVAVNTSARLMVIFTGCPVFLERRAATGSR